MFRLRKKAFKWLKLNSVIPEYGIYHKEDLACLADWYFHFEMVEIPIREKFLKKIKKLPVGVVFELRDDYKIVKVEDSL